eukprot:symbB.v1.2.037257.t1/scaffold5447.1/size27065/2
MGCFQVLKLRRLFKAMVSSVDHVIKSIFGSMAGDVAGGRFLLEDFQHFFTQQLFGEKEGKDEGTLSSTPRHPAVRFVNENSPGLLQLEMSGSASFQVNGHFALFGQELFEINVDTVGLLFQKGSVSGTIPTEHALQRHDGNNLDKSMEAGSDDSDVTFLGECFRKFLDPHDVTDIIQVLNPWTLSTLAKLFPDGKYDVALIQDTFESFSNTAVYALEETNWLHRIRGSPEECYLSCPPGADYRPDKVNHLLKTQQHLDDRRVKFYMKELQEALEAGSCRRPSALVFDFFDEGEIHAVQPDEENADDLRGPGGRRKQRRRPEACDAEYLKKWKKAWILLDGHHKVEAAARLGCSLNFLIISPCAEPYSELELDPQISSPLLRQMSCPWLWPHSTVPQSTPLCARWPEGDLCPHSPMLLSTSRQPPEVWQDVLGCDCFSKDPSFPTWGFQLLKDSFLKRLGRKKLTELLQERFGATPSTQLPPEVAEELQAELDECLDTIKWCASSITRDSLQDVKNTNRPAPVVKDVLEAVSILLAQTETRWEKLKQMISKPQFFDKLQ